MRRLLATVPVIALLALAPAAALAQSAGDDQYVDPLNGLSDRGSGSSGDNDGESAGSAVGNGESGVAGSAEADVDALPSELARTGVELPLLAGAGILLLAGGVALRRLPGERR